MHKDNNKEQQKYAIKKRKEIKTLPREEQKTTETKEWRRKLF